MAPSQRPSTGLEEGLEKGIGQGQRALLTKLLTLKFGDLTPDIRERIEATGPPDLERWATRVLTANTLDQLFDD